MFGKPAFGSPAPSTSFGTTGLFGQPVASTGGGLFNTTTTFGQQNKPTTFGFGATQQNASFMGAQQPQTSSIFNTTPSTGLFGGTTAFGAQQQQQAGTVIKFNPVTGTDTMMKNGTTQSISTKHHSITCMKEYETKSFEELRFEDYQANRKGPQQGAAGFGAPAFGATASTPSLFGGQADANKSAFGQTSAFGQSTTFGQPTAQPTAGFGAPAFGATTSTSSLFGQTDANKSAFGQTTAFGQTSTFGQNTAGFGMANQQTNSSPFGKPTFGAANTSAGFGFGTNAPQNANPFGAATPAKPFGAALPTQAQPSLLFGSNAAQPQNTGFGTGLFGSPNTQNTGTGLFNKPAQPTTGFGATGQNPGFSFSTPASTQPSLFSNTSKPLFGGGTTSTAPGFGATNTFGTTNTPVFSSAFGKPNPPTFGQNTAPGTSTFTSGFGTTTNTGAAGFGSFFGKSTGQGFGQGTFSSGLGTSLGGSTGLFGQQPKPGGLFSGGSTLFGGTNNTFQTNSFGLGQTNQQQPSLISQPEQPALNLAQLTNDPFGSPLHLIGLEPKLKTNQSAISATDPKELRSLLDVSKKIDLTHNHKLKVTPLKNARDSLFDNLSRTPDSISKSPNVLSHQRTNVRRLVLKSKSGNDATPGSAPANILDILLNEDKENRANLDVTGNSSGVGKPNPLKLTFDSTVNDSLINSSHSVETQTFNVGNFTSKEPGSDRSLRETPPPPSDDDDNVSRQGGGDAIDTHPANVICTRPEYYTLPTLDELVPDENGRCFVQGFTVGRRGYGNVYFSDEVDVSGLNLDEIVHFRYREINVYPDDTTKPPVGQGLNRKAQVTLDNVYPRRVGSNVLIKDVSELIQMNFAEKLRKVTEKKNARFVDYRPETGSWVFKVDHFSKYGFNDSDEEAEQQNNGLDPALKKPIQKQNGQKSGPLAATRVPSATELITKESLEERSEDIEVISRETSGQEPSAGSFRLDKDIYLDEEDQQEENDLLHHSMFVDEDSDDGFHPVHSHMGRPLENQLPYGYGKIDQAKNIQVMKSTLFADDDRMSDDARSQISIVKQYLDLPDEVEEMPKLPTLDEELEDFTTKKRPVIRPKVWKVLNSCQMPKATSRILPNRCCVDLGMFKGKSFKAGWSKGFNFYSLDAEDRETNSELILSAIDSTTQFDPLRDILTDSLKVVLEESTHQLNPHKVPTFKILKSRSYLKKQTALFEKLTREYNSSRASYLHNIWTLCTALWGPGENSISARRHLLSEWLKATCESDQLNLKRGRNLSVDEATESVFSYLSIFKVFDAAGIAMDNLLPNLALLIAQLSLSNTTKAFVQEQIDIWYRSQAANHISDHMKKLYLLLAGIPTKDDVNIFSGIDWKRAFGMHLWYISPNGAPIDTAIELYKKAFEDHLYAERPNPPYLSTFTGEEPHDVMYHVLMLYKSNIHRLSSTLNPATHTEDPLDYRLSWLLLQLFLSLDVGLIEQSEITKLCTSFSAQLEHLGHWEWAIFSLLYLEDNSAKANLIMGILDRNLPADFDENCQEIVDLLVNEMKIPPEWIHLVKGNKTLVEEKFFEAFNHFALAEEFVRANDIFMDKILPNLFINEQFDVIRSLAEKLKPGSKDILHWHNQTGLILEYLDLLELSIASDNLLKLQMKLCSLSERIVNFPDSNDQQKVCVAELSKRCSTLYKEICHKSQSNLFKDSYTQFVETLIMPPDFKQNEGLCLLHEVCNFNNRL